ncbi:unnamed protein product [Polarella glacialis]|uniref:Uncharacterized protein n=1 Tax=Polarella glacialis TaxID=89957 RepID=A0A813K0M8_POLGL|nr:unnamed protein product [Polarella glacialis]CAE8677712.1 unnamed protein product [Polarella glacialis]CAE8688659.1 unnamed protein product [Polarella glacialis]CAE8711035.1 unnamed protein product [Polarella glacialis]
MLAGGLSLTLVLATALALGAAADASCRGEGCEVHDQSVLLQGGLKVVKEIEAAEKIKEVRKVQGSRRRDVKNVKCYSHPFYVCNRNTGKTCSNTDPCSSDLGSTDCIDGYCICKAGSCPCTWSPKTDWKCF